MLSSRMQKINELLKREVSLLIQQEFASSLGLVAVQFVETSKDIKFAKVYISVLDKSKNNLAVKSLQKKAHEFHKILVKKMSTRNIPKLEFIIDKSQDKADRVEKLFSNIEKERSQ